MTHRPFTRRSAGTALALAATALLWLGQPPASTAQDGGPMLRIEAIPGVDQLVDIETQVRHTTVIVLPEIENILDFVVGDSEYWHLTGAANVAFLKPIATGVEDLVAWIIPKDVLSLCFSTPGIT